MMKSFVIALIVLVAIHLTSAAARKKCSDSFDEHYKGKATSYWKLTDQYDYFGNVSSKHHLSLTGAFGSLEGKINEQINKELMAHYTYTSIAAHFSRDDIFLPGFQKFFKKAAEEEAEHAQMFMEYQNKRGGQIKLRPIPAPFRQQWGNGLMAMEDALCLEKQILKSLKSVHEAANTAEDAQMMDFIEGNFLNEQIESIKILSNYVNTLKRVGDGLGEYEFDKNLLREK